MAETRNQISCHRTGMIITQASMKVLLEQRIIVQSYGSQVNKAGGSTGGLRAQRGQSAAQQAQRRNAQSQRRSAAGHEPFRTSQTVCTQWKLYLPR